MDKKPLLVAMLQVSAAPQQSKDVQHGHQYPAPNIQALVFSCCKIDMDKKPVLVAMLQVSAFNMATSSTEHPSTGFQLLQIYMDKKPLLVAMLQVSAKAETCNMATSIQHGTSKYWLLKHVPAKAVAADFAGTCDMPTSIGTSETVRASHHHRGRNGRNPACGNSILID